MLKFQDRELARQVGGDGFSDVWKKKLRNQG
jgi:hypothetical protein